MGVQVIVVHCIATDESIWRARLEARKGGACTSQAHKPQTWEELQQLLQRSGLLAYLGSGILLHDMTNAGVCCRYDKCDQWDHDILDPCCNVLLDTTDGSTPEGLAQHAVAMIPLVWNEIQASRPLSGSEGNTCCVPACC